MQLQLHRRAARVKDKVILGQTAGELPIQGKIWASWRYRGEGVGVQYHQGRSEELGRQLR